MSRCFSFPPPGYDRKGLSGETLRRTLEVRAKKLGEEKEENREIMMGRSKNEKKRSKDEQGLSANSSSSSTVTEDGCYGSSDNRRINKRMKTGSAWEDSQYRRTITDWVPSPTSYRYVDSEEDEDWLYCKKTLSRIIDVPCRPSNPGVIVRALPYTHIF